MDTLQEYRTEIDQIDEKIVELLIKRADFVSKIAGLKKENNISVKNAQREKEILYKLKRKANNSLLNSGFIEKLWKLIFKESYKIESSNNNITI